MIHDNAAAKAEAKRDRLTFSPKDIDAGEALLERIERTVAAYQSAQAAFTELARELGDEQHGVGKECQRLHSMLAETYHRIFILPLLESKSKPDGAWVDGKEDAQPVQRDPKAVEALKGRLTNLRDRAAGLNKLLNAPTVGGYNPARTQFIFPAEVN